MNQRTLLLTATLTALACPVRAAFILDDFDDPAVAISPQMFDEFVISENVGPLIATRRMRIEGAQGNPDGSLDADISTYSVLTGQITNLNPVTFGTTRVGIQLNYDFATFDFTEQGTNDALFLDFLQLTSEIPPSLLTVRLDDDTDAYFLFDTSVSLSSSPFTIVVPFHELRSRGGPNVLDPTKIEFMSFSLRASELSGGGPDPLNFFVELGRIRVGRIPEPGPLVLMCCGLLIGVHWCRQHPNGRRR